MERVHGDRARKSGASTGGASQKGKNFELKVGIKESKRTREERAPYMERGKERG